MIPKIIHYCWFGGQEKNNLIKACMETWAKYLPDFEIREWTEKDIVLDSDFAQKAFELKKWAFLSDYIRLKILYESGGVYLDTDMLFVKPVTNLLNSEIFIGKQKDGQIAAGIIGCMPYDSFIGNCLEAYKKMSFDETRLMNMAIPKIITEQYELFENKDHISILPAEYFYPYTFEDSLKGADYTNDVTPDTIAVHMWNASWFSEKEIAGFALEQKKYLKAFKYLFIFYLKNPRFLLLVPSVVFRYLTRRPKNED